MPDIATAYVQIVPTAKGIGNDLKTMLDGPAAQAGASAGASAGGGFGKALGTAVKVGGVAAAAIGAAVTGASAAFAAGAKDVAAYGDKVDKMSQKLGLSTDAYQKWDYVLTLAGTDMASMTTGLKTLTNKLDDAKNGNESAIAMFDQLGISMEQAASMSREDLFAAAIKGFQGLEDTTERAALANDLFGKSGQNLAPLFNTTAEATAEMMKQAEDYGMVMSGDMVSSAAAFQDSMTTLQGTLTGLKNSILGEFLPSMTQVTDGLAMLFAGDTEAGLESIRAGVEGFVTSFGEMVPMVLEIGSSILYAVAQGIIDNIPRLTEAAPQIIQSLINFITNNLPQIVSFAIQIIISLVTGIIQALPQLIKAVPQIIMAIVNTLRSNGPQLMTAGKTLLDFVKQGLLSVLGTLSQIGLNIVQGIWSGISGGLDWIKNMISGWVGNVLDFIKRVFKIGSPSKLMADEIGRWIPAGIAVGIEDNTGVLDSAMADLSEDMTNAFTMPDISGTVIGGEVAPQNNIQVVIYAREGQSVNDLYNTFERRLTNSVLRKEAAFA